MIFSLPTEARVVKKLYLQCVECIVKNEIKLKTYEHETVIEQNFDLQTLSFVCEIVKKNINQLILFRKLEVFLSLNPENKNKSILTNKSINHRELSTYSMLSKCLLDEYDYYLFRVILFCKSVKEFFKNVFIDDDDDDFNTLQIIQNCRQFAIKDILVKKSKEENVNLNSFAIVWVAIQRIDKEENVKKKIKILSECHNVLDVNWILHKQTMNKLMYYLL